MTSATWLRIAAGLAVLQGIAHASLILLASPKHGPEEVAVINSMKAHRFNFLGANRTYWEFYVGYALIAAVICLVEAALFWQVAPLSPDLIRPVAGVFVAYNVVHVLLAVRFFFITPIIPDLLIVVCLVLALLRAP